jgi:hypothetical protein
MTMRGSLTGSTIRAMTGALAIVTLSLWPAAAPAQVRSVDPNSAIDADLRTPAPPRATPARDASQAVDPGAQDAQPYANEQVPRDSVASTPDQSPAAAAASNADAATYQRDDVLAAAEGVFGKGAAGLAGMVEKLLKDQGEPSAYIAGREASGAIVVGLRYGSGIMTHKVEGERKVYWTGPSVGFDIGGDAAKVFVLAYNLYDTQDLYKRFPAAEGRLYLVGGFAATYLRRGNTVLIPIRLGVGWRAGVNVGYMKFTEKSKWMPF